LTTFRTARRDRDLDHALTTLYNDHYPSLVRLAALLIGSVAAGEEVVQDSFVALHRVRRRPASDSALSYLLPAVLTRTRAMIRRRALAGIPVNDTDQDTTGAGQNAMITQDDQEIISGLRILPARQREVIVLSFCADLTEAQIATTMGISRSAVKTHAARAAASLRAISPDERQ
jgi:RNA polymerase sigma factor (sigma-70 family)